MTYEQKKKVCQWHDANAALTQSQLADKAKREFGLFKATFQGTISGIVRGHQGRHGFKQLTAYGESGSVNSEEIPAQRDAIRENLKGFPLDDIYNIDETGLFLLPRT